MAGLQEEAHIAYIKKNYPDGFLYRQFTVKVELRGVGLMKDFVLDPHALGKRTFIRRPRLRIRRTIQIKAYGFQGKHHVYYSVRHLGYDAGEFISWPQVRIPFLDGEISVDALICEIGKEKIIMGPQIYR